MTSHGTTLCLLLFLFALTVSVYSQTFQYSHGWKNGRKRAIDDGSADSAKFLNIPLARMLLDYAKNPHETPTLRNYISEKENRIPDNDDWSKWSDDFN